MHVVVVRTELTSGERIPDLGNAVPDLEEFDSGLVALQAESHLVLKRQGADLFDHGHRLASVAAHHMASFLLNQDAGSRAQA
jgi:hypothetical protein